MLNPRTTGRSAGRGPASAARFRATSAAAPEPASNGLLTGLAAMQIIGTNGRKDPAASAAAGAPPGGTPNGSSTDRSHQRSARQSGGSSAPAVSHRSLSHDGVYGGVREPPHGGGSSMGGSVTGSSGPGSSREHGPRENHVTAGAQPPVMDFNTAFFACVKVFCTSVAPCYALPWVRGEESHTTGSGFAVVLPNGERRLLTHAQVLENHCLVQVRRASEAQKYVAQVVCVGYDVDIAVLNVEDAQFWRSMPLLPLPHGLPAAMSEVLTAGFPTGGEELATTRGVVNRILLGGQTRELCVQMDAPINPGNNGGPVLNVQGQLVGMACSGTQHAAGFMVPLPVIHTFLENAAIAQAQVRRPSRMPSDGLRTALPNALGRPSAGPPIACDASPASAPPKECPPHTAAWPWRAADGVPWWSVVPRARATSTAARASITTVCSRSRTRSSGRRSGCPHGPMRARTAACSSPSSAPTP